MVPKTVRARPGYRNSQRGLNISRKRRCRHPSCHVAQMRRDGNGRRADRVVGTSATVRRASAARTTISLANSMPEVRRSRPTMASRRNPRSPQ